MTQRSLMKYLPVLAVALIVAVAIARLFSRRKPRSFREDPIGALKDRGEIFAGRAQEATEEAMARLQDTIDEIRTRLPELNRKRAGKRRKNVNKRIASLSDQAQDLLKELRSNSVFSR